MYIVNLTRQIIHELSLRKLRSFLAIFCVAWGTLTVVLLSSLGDGFYTASKKNVMVIADGAFMFIPTRTSKAYQGFPRGQKLKIKAQTIVNLPKIIPNVIAATPLLNTKTNISYQGKQLNKKVYGVDLDFTKIRKLKLINGSRYFNKLDMVHSAKVAIIGGKLKTTLFREQKALGKKILINHIPFTVIAVIDNPARNIYNRHKNNAIIPYSTYIALWGNQDIPFFIALANPKANANQVKKNLQSFLAHKYHFDKNDKKVLKIFSSSKMLNFLRWFFIGIKIFLTACGSLTLGVGSLGVANIMFLIVTERTCEIGLRKAVGARDWHILLQILLEATIIIGLGGLVGFILAYSIIALLQHISLPAWLGTPFISGTTTFVTVIILSIFGILAGYFPARRAAMFDPVEALGFKK